MATYKEIHGRTVQALASDPNTAAYEGQMWFNTTSSDYKIIQKVAGAWSTGNNLGVKTMRGAGYGTQGAAHQVGGHPADATVEEYDGSSWSEIADLNQGRQYISGCGTITAGLAWGGIVSDSQSGLSEEWDNTSWSEGSNIGTARYLTGTLGVQTAAIAAGGNNNTTEIANVEEYDGTNWTEIADINTARTGMGSSGTATAGIVYGGKDSNKDENESWNGTSWTELADLNTGREYIGGSPAGTSTLALAFAGATSPPETNRAFTESWDGSSWTEVADMSTARRGISAAGTATADLGFGGADGSDRLTATEEWNVAASVETVAFD